MNNDILQILKNILKKIKPRFSFHYVAYSILIFAVIFSFVNLVTATTPNPGHPWSELGDGVFSFSNGQTASAYTYTYPSANSTVLTTNTAVTVAQGGTGVGTLTGIVIGNATSNMSAVVLGANQSIRRNSGDTAYEAFTPLASLAGAVLTSQVAGQTIGDTTNRLTKLWATDMTVTNQITGSVSGSAGSAGSVTNATLTTSLTNNGGTGGTITWPAGAPTLTIPTGGGTLGTNAFNSTAFLSSVTAHNLLSATHGDTLTDSVIRGDIMYGNATPKWARLAFPATPTGKILQATATDIAWSTNPITIGASASVSGSNTGDQTKIANLIGGNSTTLLGSIPYQSAADTTTLLTPNTTAGIKYLSMTGSGTNGAAPVWSTITGGGDMVLATAQTITGAKTFGGVGAVGKLIIAGTTSGSVILDATAAASGTVTLPNGGTLVNSVTTGNGVSATNTAGALAFTLGAIAPSSITSSGAIAANGGITFDAGTDTIGAFTAGGTISMGAQALNGTTGVINYTGFDVDASGNLDALGTITAGSGNIQVTDSAGKVQHDSIVDCADTQILKWATAGGWGCAADATGGAGGTITYQYFTTTGGGSTYTVPATGTLIIVETWGAGGGGGAGSAGVTGTNRAGGGGGGGGAYNTKTFIPTDIGGAASPVTVIAGAGGNGAAKPANRAGGADGVGGGATSFGTYLYAYGGGGGAGNNSSGAGGGGGGGSASAGTNATASAGGAGGGPGGGAANSNSTSGGGGGGSASTGGTGAGGSASFGGGGGGASITAAANDAFRGGGSIRGGGGGGGGASINTTAANRTGGAGGGYMLTATGDKGGGGAAATAGNAGVNASSGGGGGFGGTGGNGGGSSTGANGGNGGAGGIPGGGGGGGGASANNTTTSGGSGGNGGRGEIRVFTVTGSTAADLAEIYSTNDPDINSADIVSIDPTLKSGVRKSSKPYDKGLMGVISTNPNLVMGSNEDPNTSSVLLALSGRVPVKVTTENGPIKPGDLITSSSDPGLGMKAIRAGPIIGRALTGWDGDDGLPQHNMGVIMIFVYNGYYNGQGMVEFNGLVETGITPDPSMEGDDPPLLTVDKNKLILAQFISEKEQLSTSLDLSEIMTDRVMAGLEIITPTLIAGSIKTNTMLTSTGNIISFMSPVEFTIPPIFNKDTAGFAIIKKGDRKVSIFYENPYIAEPSVSASLVFNIADNITDLLANDLFNNNVNSMIVDNSQNGFTILINKDAPRDLRFSWNAFSVRDAKIFESVIEGLVVEIEPEVEISKNNPEPEIKLNSNTIEETISPTIDTLLISNEETPVIVEDKKVEIIEVKEENKVDIASEAISTEISQDSPKPEELSSNEPVITE